MTVISVKMVRTTLTNNSPWSPVFLDFDPAFDLPDSATAVRGSAVRQKLQMIRVLPQDPSDVFSPDEVARCL